MKITGYVPTGEVLYGFYPKSTFQYSGTEYVAGMRYSVREDNAELDAAVKIFVAADLVEIEDVGIA